MANRSARILLNPKAGRGRGARARERLVALASRHGISFEEATSVDDLARRAREAASAGVERLLVAGGDGTWHQALQGLVGTGTALAPVALGTGNDLACELGVPSDLAKAVASGLESTVRRIDVGEIGGRYFGCVAGAGFDSEVAEFARLKVRRLRGPLVYPFAVLRVLARFRPPRARISFDGGEFEGEVFFVSFANSSRFGGGMRIAPLASVSDGLLELVILRRVSRLEVLRIFPRVYRGSHVGHPAVSIHSTTSARFSFDRELPIVGDGETMGTAGATEVEVRVRPGALAVAARGQS